MQTDLLFGGQKLAGDTSDVQATGTNAILLRRSQDGDGFRLILLFYRNLTPGDPIDLGAYDEVLNIGEGLVNGSLNGRGVVALRRPAATGTEAGAIVSIGRNDGGGGAAACLQLQRADGDHRYLWIDANDKLRIGNHAPLEDGSVSDTSGSIVGP